MLWCGAAVRRVMTATEQRLAYSSLSSVSTSTATPILCGRGDKRTKKGKRFKGSYGNSRPKKEKQIERIKDKVEVPRSTPWPLPFKLIWFNSNLLETNKIQCYQKFSVFVGFTPLLLRNIFYLPECRLEIMCTF